MITRAYSIFDTKSLIFGTPWFQPTDGAATRMVEDLVNDPQTRIHAHPADYVLYCIGSYDDARGRMEPCDPLIHIIDAVALVRRDIELQQPLFTANVDNVLNNGRG